MSARGDVEVSCGISKTHLYIDAAVRLHDLRGRNFVNNLVQLAFAECLKELLGGAEVARIGGGVARLTTEERVSLGSLEGFARLLNSLNLPAIMSVEVKRNAEKETLPYDYEAAEGVRLRAELAPDGLYDKVRGRCSICQTPVVVKAQGEEWKTEFFRHVVRDELLCPACLVARFAGRVLNNAMVVNLHGVVRGVDFESIKSTIEEVLREEYERTNERDERRSERGAIALFFSQGNANYAFLSMRHRSFSFGRSVKQLGDLAANFFTLRLGGETATYVNVLVGFRGRVDGDVTKSAREQLRSVCERPFELGDIDVDEVLSLVYSSFKAASRAFINAMSEASLLELIRNSGLRRVFDDLRLSVDLSSIDFRRAYREVPKGKLVINPLFLSVNLEGWARIIDLDLLYAYSPGTGIAVVRSDGDHFGNIGDYSKIISIVGGREREKECKCVEPSDEWEKVLEETLLRYFKCVMPLLMSFVVPSINVYYGGDENLFVIPASLRHIRSAIYLVRNTLLATVVRALQNLSSKCCVSLPGGRLERRLVSARSGTLSAAVVMSIRKFPMYYLVSFANLGVEAAKTVRDATLMVYVVSVSQAWPRYEAWFRDSFRVPVPNEILDKFVTVCMRTSGEPVIHRAYQLLNGLALTYNEPVDSKAIGHLRKELVEALSNAIRGMDEVVSRLKPLEAELCGVSGIPTLDTIRSVHKGVE